MSALLVEVTVSQRVYPACFIAAHSIDQSVNPEDQIGG